MEFDALTHSYAHEGKKLPSVTQIISRVIPRSWNADEWALRRGSMVHKAIKMHLEGTLDPYSLDERINGRVQAAIDSISIFKWEPFAVEQSMMSSLGYAGTPDMITQCGSLVDWKGTCEAACEIQLGLYSLMAKENKIGVKNLYSIVTKDDGFKCVAFNQRRAEAIAIAVFGVYGWMVKNKIGEEK